MAKHKYHRARQVIVFRRAQEAEYVRRMASSTPSDENQAVLLRLGAEDLEDQLLLAHAAGARNGQGFWRFFARSVMFFFLSGPQD